MFGTGEGLLGYEPHSETCSVQERGLWGTDYSPEHVWYRRGASDVRNAPQNTLGIGKWAIVCRINEKRIPVQEGLLRYGTGSGARLVHGRGFCGTERDGGHCWYTGGASAVRKGMEDTVGTREGLLRYGKGWRARLVHHNGYWCTKCTERRIYTQDEATPKPTRGR